MDDLVATACRLVTAHPDVTGAEFAGSRSRGEHDELSDWDVAVQTSDFAAVARDMHALVAPLEPIGEQWEPMGHFPVYQVMLRGPTKLEYLFLDESQDAQPTPVPGPDTLGAIDNHFWDWIWWLITKEAAGRADLVAEHMPPLHAHLLRPLGIAAVPEGIADAIAAFVARRDALEHEYGVSVPRALEDEIRAGYRRIYE